MEQKMSSLAQQLWSLTADLRPAAEGTPDDLHRARVAIASALTSSKTSIAPRSAPAVSQTPVEPTQALQELLDTAVSESSPELLESADFVVARREVPLAVAGLSSLAPNAIGSFTDARYLVAESSDQVD